MTTEQNFDTLGDTPVDVTDQIVADHHSGEQSIYDDLRDALSADAELEDLILKVPNRPTISLVIDVRFDFDTLEAWQSKATVNKKSRRKKEKVLPRLLADIILANQMVGLRVKGRDAHAKDGSSLTFATPELWDLLSSPEKDRDKADAVVVTGTREAIAVMFNSDGHVIQAMGEILDAAGYGDVDWESEDEDDEGPLEP